MSVIRRIINTLNDNGSLIKHECNVKSLKNKMPKLGRKSFISNKYLLLL